MSHTTTLRRHGTVTPAGKGVVLPAHDPAVRYGRTIFLSRVFDPDEVQRLLKDGHQSRKIGKIVQKGRLKGAPIFTLTLEERATCPRSCLEFQSCYGNRMQAAERIVAGPELEAVLVRELTVLQASHPAGFLLRLHVLGDFYSIAYVRFWSAMLNQFPALNVFGFTAHRPTSKIGREIYRLTRDHGWSRFAVRYSGAAGKGRASRVIEPQQTDPDAILCPAQTGASECCATCGLCWQSERSIAFRRH